MGDGGEQGPVRDGMACIRPGEEREGRAPGHRVQALRLPRDQLEVANGSVVAKGRPWLTFSLKEIVNGYVYPNGNTIEGPVIGNLGVLFQLEHVSRPRDGLRESRPCSTPSEAPRSR